MTETETAPAADTLARLHDLAAGIANGRIGLNDLDSLAAAAAELHALEAALAG